MISAQRARRRGPDNRVAIVVTDSLSLALMRGWPRELSCAGGLELHFYANGASQLAVDREADGFSKCIEVPLARSISPLQDTRALLGLLRSFRRERYLVVQASTPKAGLLGMVAGVAAGVPERVYTIRGLRLETTAGATWHLLRLAEVVAIRCATEVTVISGSLRDELERMGLLRHARSVSMFGHGSSNGIDSEVFYREQPAEQAPIRRRLGIPASSFVLLFVGRLAADKGIRELDEAWGRVRESIPESMLLVVGQPEDDIGRSWVTRLLHDNRCRWVGWRPEVRPYYEASNLLVLPSYREGLGNVILEAAAVGVPAVATDVTGCRDAVINGTTGLLVAARDSEALARAIVELSRSPSSMARFAGEARRRVVSDFSQRAVWDAQLAFYRDVTVRGRATRSRRRSNALGGAWGAMRATIRARRRSAKPPRDKPASMSNWRS